MSGREVGVSAVRACVRAYCACVYALWEGGRCVGVEGKGGLITSPHEPTTLRMHSSAT